MNPMFKRLTGALALMGALMPAHAAPALAVIGRDVAFPQAIEGMPRRLSDVQGLQINHFTTNDGVRLAYWEIGQGRPLIMVPGWSANGAEYINLLHLLGKKYRVVVLDPRNQGLSQRVDHGHRIARHAADLRGLVDHLGLAQADFCGWSMGASIVWSYIDLYGTSSLRKAVFIDEPVSIYSHADWTEQRRLEAGALTSSPERMAAAFTGEAPTNGLYLQSQAFSRYGMTDSPYFVNSEAFARAVVRNDVPAMRQVLFDHAVNDWRDVLQRKVNVPTAIFTGVHSDSLSAQRWMHSVIAGSVLHVYSDAEQGDHFLAFKNPVKFSADLAAFLDR